MNWDKIKTEIDIEQYFLFKMGASFSFDKYKQAYPFPSIDIFISSFFKYST